MDLFVRVKQAITTATSDDRAGAVAMLAAGVLTARGVRNASGNRRRAAGQLLAAAVLLGVGLRQRDSSAGTSASERAGTAPDDEEKVSDDAHAARERSDVMRQSETNPRGTSDEPEVEPKSELGEGDIQFSTEQDAGPRSEPRLDDAPDDPRYEDEEGIEVDLSETAMADEASEATGPDPEQAQPTQTEDTEPESSPPEDASHMEADESDADRDADGGEVDDPESEETAATGADDERGSDG